LENKVKDLEASLEKKDFLLQAAEGSLAEAQSQNTKLREELEEKSERFDQETKELRAKAEAETEKNTKLHESLKDLQNKCADFATRCVNRLKGIFKSVGHAAEEITPSAEDIPRAFEHIENKVDALGEVISGHGDFCALVASRGTAAAFMKAGCTHAKVVNKPTFNLSASDIIDIMAEARSIGNRFITKFGLRAGASWLGTKLENCLIQYETFIYLLPYFPLFRITLYFHLCAGWWHRRLLSQSLYQRAEDSCSSIL
jgi:hypothetical protein